LYTAKKAALDRYVILAAELRELFTPEVPQVGDGFHSQLVPAEASPWISMLLVSGADPDI